MLRFEAPKRLAAGLEPPQRCVRPMVFSPSWMSALYRVAIPGGRILKAALGLRLDAQVVRDLAGLLGIGGELRRLLFFQSPQQELSQLVVVARAGALVVLAQCGFSLGRGQPRIEQQHDRALEPEVVCEAARLRIRILPHHSGFASYSRQPP